MKINMESHGILVGNFCMNPVLEATTTILMSYKAWSLTRVLWLANPVCYPLGHNE